MDRSVCCVCVCVCYVLSRVIPIALINRKLVTDCAALLEEQRVAGFTLARLLVTTCGVRGAVVRHRPMTQPSTWGLVRVHVALSHIKAPGLALLCDAATVASKLNKNNNSKLLVLLLLMQKSCILR